jgi:nitrite reductase (NO-forming)
LGGEEAQRQQNSSAIAAPNNNNNASEVKILKGSWNPKQKDSYSPNQVVTKSGTTITWINEDNLPHTVTSDKTGLFDSSIVSANQKWKYRFDTVGEYEYHCTLHPWMEGKVKVTSVMEN